MADDEARVIFDRSELSVVLPLTQPTGKIRIKERSFFSEYGLPVAARQTRLGLKHYVEWQIGYDLLAKSENEEKTSLRSMMFKNYKGENKFAYELSEILYYSYQRGLVDLASIRDAYVAISSIPEEDTFERLDSMNISRTNPKEVDINGLPFYQMLVSYPMLVHKFGKYDIYAEVVIKEKQRAVGTQAMLYVCLPLSTLRFKRQAIGRVLDARETAEWIIGGEEAALSLELFRVFGMLSPKHRCDVLAIMKMLFPEL